MKTRYGIITAALLAVYTFGWGRAYTPNPIEIAKVALARNFEKRLATQMIGDTRFWPVSEREERDWKEWRADYDKIFGYSGLADTNGVPGIQASEYKSALSHIYRKPIRFLDCELWNDRTEDVLRRGMDHISKSQLETAIQTYTPK
jgi:hypothetical protein